MVLATLKRLAEIRFPFLTYLQHLPYLLKALEQTSGVHAVIDPLLKPPIASGALEPRGSPIERVAKFASFFCKLSETITEADHTKWDLQSLKLYVDHIFSIFRRLHLFGSN